MTSSLQASDDAAAAVAVAPRVTLADIEANIVCEFSYVAADVYAAIDANVVHGFPVHYFSNNPAPTLIATQALGLLTLHIIVTKSGFTFVGQSACASPENFNAELGRKFAREDAMRQMWLPMGYALKEKLANSPKYERDELADAYDEGFR